ncbi:MAG: hypothetical protein AAFY82_05610, partial [Pseudomonadota bacterium]
MARLDIKEHVLKRFARRSKTLISASAVGLFLTGAAEGQEGDPGIAIDSLDSLQSWRLTETGDLELVFESGSLQTVSAADFTLVDGTYYISESLAAELVAIAETVSVFAIRAPIALSIGGGIAVAGALSQDDDDDPAVPEVPVPDPDVAPVITSAATASVAENQTTALTVAASDADGD